jgi:hypothetical protein
MAVEEQMEKRKLVGMRRQSSGLVMLQFRKNNPGPGVFMQHLSVEVTRPKCLRIRADVWGIAHD